MSTTNGSGVQTALISAFYKRDEIPKLDKKPPEMGIERWGDKIVSPEKLTYRASGDALIERAELEEREMVKHETFVCHPNDGLVCFTELLQEVFGWITPKPPGMFEKPPETIRIPVSLTEWKEVFSYGRLSVPGLPGVEFTTEGDVMNLQFTVYVKATYAHQGAISQLFDWLRAKITAQSIYKGKAIKTDFTFLDVNSGNIDKVILNKETKGSVLANLITPIRAKEKCKELGIPFRRNVLLNGPYGTGKTYLGLCVGKEAIQKGVTYISVTPEHLGYLATWIKYARLYAPSVLFFEDVDLVTEGSSRSHGIHEILNNLDGVDTKEQELMVLMTSNHADRINKAMLRPGRLDAVIYVGPSEKDAAAELVELYGNGLLEDGFDFDRAGEATKGMVPAFIREVVDRSKLIALSRNPHDVPRLTAEDIEMTASYMNPHIAMVNAEDESLDGPSAFGHMFVGLMEQTVRKHVEELVPAIGNVANIAAVAANESKSAHKEIHKVNENIGALGESVHDYTSDDAGDGTYRKKFKDNFQTI